jgi:cell shape-determining protein MreD
VILLRGVIVVLALTGMQAGLERLWPAAHGYVDLLALPVIWYAIVGGQRAGMLAGCAAGLLQDAWFELGAFGLSGFKRTLLGWTVGGIGSWLDLSVSAARLLVGIAFSLADSALDVALGRMLDLQQGWPSGLEIAGRALVTGVLAWLGFDAFRKIHPRRDVRGWAEG